MTFFLVLYRRQMHNTCSFESPSLSATTGVTRKLKENWQLEHWKSGFESRLYGEMFSCLKKCNCNKPALRVPEARGPHAVAVVSKGSCPIALIRIADSFFFALNKLLLHLAPLTKEQVLAQPYSSYVSIEIIAECCISKITEGIIKDHGLWTNKPCGGV